jgi:superfamily II DNA or RNA helicase
MIINEERRKLQEEAITAVLKSNGKAIVILPTGTGKTFVLIECFKRLYKPGMKVLYTCDSQNLRDKGFDDELNKWGASEYSDIIEKKCYAAAYKMQEEYYDILLADEGDYALTPEYSKLFFRNKFRYIIFVSATLEAKKRKLAKEIAPIVYYKQVKEIEEAGVVNKCQIHLVPYRLNKAENARYIRYNKAFTSLLRDEQTPAVKKSLEFLKTQRLHFIAGLESSAYICRRLMKELYDQDKNIRMLVFCGLKSQADKVCKYSYHGDNEEDDNLERFNKGEINVLSVVGKVNRGVNLTSVNAIICENMTSSETLMIQRTGRGRRLKVGEMLNVYILVPYFEKDFAKIVKHTIVKDWVTKACRNLGIENAKIYHLKTEG